MPFTFYFYGYITLFAPSNVLGAPAEEKAGMSLTKINGFHYYCNDMLGCISEDNLQDP